ncbi:MAG: preprotein translocase subunit SecY [Patescibacteria group bacterium]
MGELLNKIKFVFTDEILRRRIIFVLGALVVFRVLATIPIPGIDALRLEQFLSNNQFFGLLNIFSGGGLSNLSIVMLGVGPYITSSIIMQLLTIMVPTLKKLYHEEGELGRRKFTQYSRLLTIPLAMLQGLGLLILLERQGVIEHLDLFSRLLNLAIITGGSILLMWIGELVSEFGVGNGVSIIIFAGIVAAIPSQVGQLLFTFDISQLPLYLAFLIAALLIVAGVVFITEAERPLPVTYAKRVRGMKVYGGVATYLPLRLNQAGVIPIIFALSILLFPQMVGTFLSTASNAILAKIGAFLVSIASNSWVYSISYFVLVVLFTYFYTAVTFDPNSIAENLQKNGAFIPGVRPGNSTSEYIARVLNRITLFGALFLGLIAVLPLAMQGITGIATLAIGGTALLIVVSVVLDLIKKIDAQISMREY